VLSSAISVRVNAAVMFVISDMDAEASVDGRVLESAVVPFGLQVVEAVVQDWMPGLEILEMVCSERYLCSLIDR